MTLTAASVLAESAGRRPDHPALVFGSERITYAGLWNAGRRYPTALRDHGVMALGAVAVPVHGLLRADEIVHVLGGSEAKALVCAAPLLAGDAKAAEVAGVPLLTVMVEDGTDDDGRHVSTSLPNGLSPWTAWCSARPAAWPWRRTLRAPPAGPRGR